MQLINEELISQCIYTKGRAEKALSIRFHLIGKEIIKYPNTTDAEVANIYVINTELPSKEKSKRSKFGFKIIKKNLNVKKFTIEWNLVHILMFTSRAQRSLKDIYWRQRESVEINQNLARPFWFI